MEWSMLANWKRKHRSQIDDYKFRLYLLRRSPLTIFGAIILGCLIIASVFAAWISPYPEDGMMIEVHPADRLLSPSLDHFFGTDPLGRDILSVLMFGCRISLVIAVLIMFLSAVIGIPLGLVAGYRGKIVDEFIMRITDIIMSIPPLLLALLIVSVIGPSINNAIIAISLTQWTRYTRITRGEVLHVKEEKYVTAAKAFGAGDLRVIFRHILPNVLSPLLVQGSMDGGRAILFAASLSFIGMGATPPSPEWGLTLSMARSYMPSYWWYAFFPGLAIMVTVMGFSFLGDGIRDILDPKTRR
jgi:peptide/nickel transport system permease protein